MVEKKQREALKANNRVNKYGKCKPPKQKIKIMIGEITVKQENIFCIMQLHVLSSASRDSKHMDAFLSKQYDIQRSKLRLLFISLTGVECCFPLCTHIDAISSPQLREGMCIRNHTWGIIRYIGMGQPRAGTLANNHHQYQSSIIINTITLSSIYHW